MIPFNKASISDVEVNNIKDALTKKLCGDGEYTKKVNEFFLKRFGIKNFLLTTSCSSALDMTAILLNLKEGDEVIMPSFTFVSTANAIVLRGAKPVFCDVEPNTMNINANLIEGLITNKTKAIYVVHYAGRVCDMDKIMKIAKKHNLYVVEDAAQAVGSYYKGKVAGTIGDMGCYSFHETKNYSMGEGGALIINNPKFVERAEIIREKGTNRGQFLRGQVDKYTWQDMGSSYLPSDVLSAMLYGQMQRFDEIMKKRMAIWQVYKKGLQNLEKQGKIILQIGESSVKQPEHNAHMFYLLVKNIEVRDKLIAYLKTNGYAAVYHYVPLHSAPFATKYLKKTPSLPITEEYSERLIRLPMYADLPLEEAKKVVEIIKKFYMEEK